MATDTLRVAVGWGLGSNTPYAFNVFHFKFPSTVFMDPDLGQAITDALRQDFVAAGTSTTQSADFRYVGTRIGRTELGEGSLSFTPTAGPLTMGAVSAGNSDTLPRGLALVVTLRTAFISRKGTGRTYIPGWQELANSAAGGPSVSAQARAVDLVNRVKNTAEFFGNGNTRLAVYSRGADISYPVTQILMRDAVWDRQWRRSLRGSAEA